jgi:hypothetical protein
MMANAPPKPIMYFSKDCVYSRSMLETLVRHRVRGVMACVCVETQAALVPHFVNCTPSVYIPAEKKLLKNSAVKAYVEGLVASSSPGTNVVRASPAAVTGAAARPTTTTTNTTVTAAQPSLSPASAPETPSDPDAVNAVEHRATYSWIGDDAEGRRNDLRSGTLPFASFGGGGGGGDGTTTAAFTNANANANANVKSPVAPVVAAAPALSKREILMNARLKQMQAQREAEMSRRV